MAYITFNLIIVITLLFGSFFIHRFNTLHVIYECSIILTAITPLLFVSNITLRLVIIFIQGIFFSLGQLASFTYFWSLTASEERGRVVGIVGFFILPLFQIIGPITQIIGFTGAVVITIFLSLGTLTIRLFEPKKKSSLTRKKDEEGYYHEKKTVLLYTIPWILFLLVNATLARNISSDIFESVPISLYTFLLILQIIASGFGALVGGIVADFIGRRSAIGTSLTLFGISIVLGGLFPISGVLYFMYIVNGLTWGILWTLYFSVVWGDLGNKENVAKIYSMGLMIFYMVNGISFLFIPQISQISLVTSSFLGCLLVFLSNIPVIIAPELLPSDFRDKIKLRLHINTLKRVRKKTKNHG
jgi:sugar phosphate permease